MSVKLTSLNGDASFMLQFHRETSSGLGMEVDGTSDSQDDLFTVFIDPWLNGPFITYHPYFSFGQHCLSDTQLPSLTSLPSPDLIIISQANPDHCHRETLTQLPARGGNFKILAEPASAKLIRSWKYFDEEIIIPLVPFDEKCNSTYNTAVPRRGIVETSEELTVAYLPEKGDITGLFKAIGITYSPMQAHVEQDSASEKTMKTTHKNISILFAPHGISLTDVNPWISSHLHARNAFPLTLLLHCFNFVEIPFFIGTGTITKGVDGGSLLATNLKPTSWISCHDGAKELSGIANRWLKMTEHSASDVKLFLTEKLSTNPEVEVISMSPGETRIFTT